MEDGIAAPVSADRTQTIEQLVASVIDPMGYRLVRARYFGGNRARLQVMMDRGDGKTVTVDDCAAASRALSVVLDVEDPIAGQYELEVSSPGIDRPLVRLEDFERYNGHEAKVELARARDGQRKFRGCLAGVSDGHVSLAPADGGPAIMFDLEDVRDAKLVLTDALIAAHLEDNEG